MAHSNWHTRKGSIRDSLDEEKVQRAIDTLVSYRRPEVLGTVFLLWVTFLLMTGSLLLTIRAVLTFPLF